MPLNYKIFDKQVTSLVAFLQETYSFTTIYSGIYYYVLHITSYYNLKGTSFVISHYLMDVYGTIMPLYNLLVNLLHHFQARCVTALERNKFVYCFELFIL